MDSPGLKNLGDVALAAINAATAETVITSAADIQGVTQAYFDRLDGMVGATISANFVWGSGSGTLKVIVYTTINQGITWIEVARLAFAAASKETVINLTNAPRTTPYAPIALSDDSSVDGILGDRFKVSILKAGTVYAGNTSLSVRLNAR